MTGQSTRARRWGLHSFLGLATLSIVAAEAESRGPQLARIQDIRQEGVRRAVFVLTEPTAVEIEAVGAGDRRGRALLASAWILDLSSREASWTQLGAAGEQERRTGNWVTQDEITLDPGIYGVYFAAHSGTLPLDTPVRILGWELGRLRGDFRWHRDWDDVGDPRKWGVSVWAADANHRPAPVPAQIPEPYPGAPIRLVGLRDSEVREARFDVSREVEVELRATGEYVPGSRYFADTAWLVECESWRRVFTLTPENTEPAGGAEKNRVFSGKLRLPPGTYLLGTATDDSHASGSWNDAPPWDPDAWGAVLWVADPDARDALTLGSGAARPEPDVAIERVGDDAFLSERFSLSREARLLVRATGEQVGGESPEFADFGWIETVGDLREVWSMDGDLSYPAGGARKNRLVEETIALPAGDYLLCYQTDGSHAYETWNDAPPFDREFWGITLTEIGPGAEPALHLGGHGEAAALVSIAPVGNDQHIVKRFEVTETTSVRLVAIGEGVDGEMADYAWLDDASGRTLWRMDYRDTGRAGGAVKNRQVEVVLELPPGKYELHYRTDGSHAFGDWNAPPPRRPHLWGVTLLEADEPNP